MNQENDAEYDDDPDEERAYAVEHRWWLIDPEGHRQYDVENGPADGSDMEFLGMTVKVIRPPVPTGWWCDWCNAEIPLIGENGKKMFSPMFMSNGLCPKCFSDVLTKDPETPARLTEFHGNLGPVWSDRSCGCPPCSKRLEVLLAMRGVHGKTGKPDATE